MSYNEKVEFEWSETKNSLNLKKHGISFSEAVTVWKDSFVLETMDPDHLEEEERWIRIGRSSTSKTLVIVYCERLPEKTIRIISARKANPIEEQTYYSRM